MLDDFFVHVKDFPDAHCLLRERRILAFGPKVPLEAIQQPVLNI